MEETKKDGHAMTVEKVIVTELPSDAMTIKQIADLLGVSKGALQKRINRYENKQAIDKYVVWYGQTTQTKYVLKEGIDIIKGLYIKVIADVHIDKSIPVSIPKSIDKSTDLGYGQLVDLLKEKDVQIQKLQKLLDQEQQLHLMDKQRLLRLEQTTSSNTEEESLSFFDKVKRFFGGGHA